MENYNSTRLISELSKIYKLRENKIYSEEEYSKRKDEILTNVLKNGISQSLEDFLSDILILKEQNILTIDEIYKLKNNLFKNTMVQVSPTIENTDVICSHCGNKEVININSEKYTKGVYVCPICNSINTMSNAKDNVQTIINDGSLSQNVKTGGEYKFLIVMLSIAGIIGLAILINYIVYLNVKDTPDYKLSPSNQTSNTNSQIKEGPSLSDIEKEATIVVSTIPYKNFQYNTGLFLGRNGVYKNLAVTTVRVNSRKGIKLSDKGIEEEEMNLNISGIADAFSVYGMAQTRYEGRTNFIVDKDFNFTKTKGRWVGYIYDNARNKRNMSRVEKEYMRFR